MITYKDFFNSYSDKTIYEATGLTKEPLVVISPDVKASANFFHLDKTVKMSLSFVGFNLAFELDFNKRELKLYDYYSRISNPAIFVNIIKSLVDFASRLEFKKMTCFAAGNSRRYAKCALYHLCALSGFTPAEAAKSLILNRLKDHGYERFDAVTIFHTDIGLEFWKDFGFEWQAEFDLAPSSINRELLQLEINNLKMLQYVK